MGGHSPLFRLTRLNLSADAVDGLTGFLGAATRVVKVQLDRSHLALVSQGLKDFLLKLGLEVFNAHFSHGTTFVNSIENDTYESGNQTRIYKQPNRLMARTCGV
jgi:hypothetical protein